MNSTSNGTQSREPAAAVEDIDADDGATLRQPTKKELDAAFARARAAVEPVIEIAFLATALAGAVSTAWERAKRSAAKRARERKT